jgi:hypothetical protein
MAKKENTEKTKTPSKKTTPDTSKTKDRVIPVIPKEERSQLNEGVDPKIDTSKKSND